jgi:hypothetical protein
MLGRERKLFRKDGKGLSPAISTIIMTAAIITMVLIAMAYGQNYLTSSMAQNEFKTNEQFMITTGLQIDNVAWMIGRAQTIQYSGTYGNLQLLPQALNYTIEMYKGSVLAVTYTVQTGIILYNVPITEYSLGNNYLNPLSSSNNLFLQNGAGAPDSDVYAIEKLPMSDGNFLRIVVVPTMRMMNTTVGGENYAEFYLPMLEQGSTQGHSQSATLICKTINQYIQSGITQVKITMTFPLASQGFNSGFFPFQSTTQTVQLNSTVQLYVGDVSVSIGLYG